MGEKIVTSLRYFDSIIDCFYWRGKYKIFFKFIYYRFGQSFFAFTNGFIIAILRF